MARHWVFIVARPDILYIYVNVSLRCKLFFMEAGLIGEGKDCRMRRGKQALCAGQRSTLSLPKRHFGGLNRDFRKMKEDIPRPGAFVEGVRSFLAFPMSVFWD